MNTLSNKIYFASGTIIVGKWNVNRYRVIDIIGSGENVPTIPYIQPIPATDPTESSSLPITFNFTASDPNGAGNLNDSTAQVYFQLAGQTTRYNSSCVAGSIVGNTKNYTCTVRMWYFDANGAWTINATIKNVNGIVAENTSSSFARILISPFVQSHFIVSIYP